VILPRLSRHHASGPQGPRGDAAVLHRTVRQSPTASRHAFGWDARDATDKARAQVAALINASAADITFTSGATESSNLALKGAVEALQARGLGAQASAKAATHIVTVTTEHKSVLDVCLQFRRQGLEVTVLGVGPGGLVDLDALRAAITTPAPSSSA